MYLQGQGYRVISFSYDDVAQRPDHCISLLRLLFSQYEPSQAPVGVAQLTEKEVIRLALYLARPLRPIDVSKHFDVNHRTAIKWINSLCQKGWLHPMHSGSHEKVFQYELIRGVEKYIVG